MRSGVLTGLAALAAAVLCLPLIGLAARAPWGEVAGALGEPDVGRALLLTGITATVAAAVCAVLGIPLGYLLARDRRWAALRPVVVASLLLPPVTAGVALDLLVGGGSVLDLSGGPAGVVLAQVVVALPWCALAVEAAVRDVDPRLEETALLHGVPPARIRLEVTLPAARRGLVAGVALAWARALAELGATTALAGALPGRTEVATAAAFLRVRTDPAQAAALALVLLLAALAVALPLRHRLAVWRP